MTHTPKVAALFVRRDSHYFELGCDCYDIDRDALTWQGGCPGVFHPPCRSWGQLAHFAKPRPGERELALWAVAMARKWGGVVEHPYSSRLWAAVGCASFGVRDQFGGVLLPLKQSWFGHRAPKATCIYFFGPVPDLSQLPDVPAPGRITSMGKAERERTPLEFARFLVDLASACRPLEVAAMLQSGGQVQRMDGTGRSAGQRAYFGDLVKTELQKRGQQ